MSFKEVQIKIIRPVERPSIRIALFCLSSISLLITSLMLPILFILFLPFSTVGVLSYTIDSNNYSFIADPYIVQLCEKSSKLFETLADSRHMFYDVDSHILGTSYFSKNVYSRQSYVSNGYIGARLSTLGQGFAYDEINTHTDSLKEEVLQNGWPLFNKRYTGAFVAGFFSLQETLPDTNFPELYENGYDSVLSSIPYWANIELIVEKDGEEFRFNPEFTRQDQVSSYNQNTSMSNGVVSTKLVWLDSIVIKIDVFAHKEVLPLGVVSIEVGALHSDVRLILRDSLNISTSERTTLKDIGYDDDGIYIEVNPDNVNYSSAAIYSSWDYQNDPEFTVSDGVVTHEDTIVLKPLEKLKVTKYVGVISTEFNHGNGLPERAHAKQLVSFIRSTSYEELRENHNSAWKEQFEETNIYIPSDELLTLAARSSLYHLLANTQTCANGLSSALGVSGLSSDSYGGMVFWDTDVWIVPGIVPFAPNVAKAVSNYRNFTHKQAVDNAKLYNYSGAAYPWTSGRFGNCTSTGPCIDYEYHVNVDVALSSWLLYLAGEDEVFLRYTTWPLLRDAADFLSEYTTFDPTLEKFITKNLTDPDEYANHVNNGAFTNSGIDTLLKVTILVARHLNETINPRWIDVHDEIYIPVSKSGITLEYSGMNASVLIKQADVVLLTFPLNYHEDSNQAIQDLFYYSLKQADIGPAMTFPIFTTVAARLLNHGCSSQSYLKKSVIPYLRSPFAQFSEQADENILTNGGTHPAFPFLTAHGAYLQAIVYGILGLRYSARFSPTTEKFEKFLKFDPVRASTLPGGVRVTGFRYRHQLLDVSITDTEGIIVHKGSEPISIEVASRNDKSGNYTINPGEVFRVPAFIPGLNILDSLTECEVIANLTAGSPGEVALSAIDGNNYTYWQPLSRYEPARLLIDLGYEQQISRGLVIWGSRPAKTFSLYVHNGPDTSFSEMLNSVQTKNFTKVIEGFEVEITEPFDPLYLQEVKLLPNNETSFIFDNPVSTRYVIFEVEDVLDEQEEEGATISEIALFQ